MSSCPRYPLVALWSTARVDVVFYASFHLTYTQAGASAGGSLSFVGGRSQVGNFQKGKCFSGRNWQREHRKCGTLILHQFGEGGGEKKIPSVWQIQKRIWLRHDGILSVSHLCANLLMFYPKWTKKEKRRSQSEVAVIRRGLLSGCPKRHKPRVALPLCDELFR